MTGAGCSARQEDTETKLPDFMEEMREEEERLQKMITVFSQTRGYGEVRQREPEEPIEDPRSGIQEDERRNTVQRQT